jgi:hypothetical protein
MKRTFSWASFTLLPASLAIISHYIVHKPNIYMDLVELQYGTEPTTNFGNKIAQYGSEA